MTGALQFGVPIVTIHSLLLCYSKIQPGFAFWYQLIQVPSLTWKLALK